MSGECLPESRLKEKKGAIFMVWGAWGKIQMEPIFCASCGKLGGYCPAENMTFAFWLCDGLCADKWATLAGTYVSTDEVYWEKVKGEMIEKYGHYLDEAGVLKAEESTCNSLATLLRESPLHRG